MEARAIFIFTALVACFNFGAALLCYQCSSESRAGDCARGISDLGSVYCRNTDPHEFLTSIFPGLKGRYPKEYCFAAVLRMDFPRKIIYTRGCNSSPYDPCNDPHSSGPNYISCKSCASDYCNDSPL